MTDRVWFIFMQLFQHTDARLDMLEAGLGEVSQQSKWTLTNFWHFVLEQKAQCHDQYNTVLQTVPKACEWQILCWPTDVPMLNSEQASKNIHQRHKQQKSKNKIQGILPHIWAVLFHDSNSCTVCTKQKWNWKSLQWSMRAHALSGKCEGDKGCYSASVCNQTEVVNKGGRATSPHLHALKE